MNILVSLTVLLAHESALCSDTLDRHIAAANFHLEQVFKHVVDSGGFPNESREQIAARLRSLAESRALLQAGPFRRLKGKVVALSFKAFDVALDFAIGHLEWGSKSDFSVSQEYRSHNCRESFDSGSAR